MIIYLDMDDVVADWRQAAENFLKLKFPNNDPWARITDDKWAELKRQSPIHQAAGSPGEGQNLRKRGRTKNDQERHHRDAQRALQ